MKNVLIAGGTGLVGQHIKEILESKGYDVFILSRTPKSPNQFYWDPAKGEIDGSVLAKIHVLINTTGAGIADKRWTQARKTELFESRIGTNEFLHSQIEKMPLLEQFICSSGVNCYGYEEVNRIHEESDPFGQDYLSQLVRAWEESSDLFAEKCIVTHIRTSMVLDGDKGAIPKLVKTINLGIGSPLGSGKQDLPWIHAEDLAAIFVFTMENKLGGSFNACAGYETNARFLKTIATVLNKPFWFPNVPSFALKMLLGEMSSMLLLGIKVSNKKLTSKGFKFKFTDLKEALKDVLK